MKTLCLKAGSQQPIIFPWKNGVWRCRECQQFLFQFYIWKEIFFQMLLLKFLAKEIWKTKISSCLFPWVYGLNLIVLFLFFKYKSKTLTERYYYLKFYQLTLQSLSQFERNNCLFPGYKSFFPKIIQSKWKAATIERRSNVYTMNGIATFQLASISKAVKNPAIKLKYTTCLSWMVR